MAKIALNPVDLALVLAYLIGVTALGLWLSRGVKSSKDFFLAGKTLPWWAVGMSLSPTSGPRTWWAWPPTATAMAW